MTLWTDDTEHPKRERVQEAMAHLVAAAFGIVALVLLPTASTLTFALALPDAAAHWAGWVTIGALLAVPTGFPLVHIAAHQVLVGRPPRWAASPRRWLRIGLFATGVGIPLLLVFTTGGAFDMGLASFVWGIGVLAMLAAGTRSGDQGGSPPPGDIAEP